MKLTFVLPTRNRAELAIAAIRSLLAQEGCAVRIVVSDNSSSEEEVRLLAEFCRNLGDSRLLYARPPQALLMATHWNWAAEQAMERTDGTHFGIQYDRKLWKPGALRPLVSVCEQHPEAMVAYGSDVALERPSGVVTWIPRATGRLYEIRTATLVRLTSRGMVQELGLALPVFANCMVPRATLERMRARFGTICDSAAPDSAFTYRFAATEDRYLYLDDALVFAYAYRLSNGFAYFRGDTRGTYGDWVNLWGDRPWLDAAPIPGLSLGQNVMFHEYNMVQRVVGEERFPPIDREGYLRELAHGLHWIDDPAHLKEMRRVLREHGWREKRRPLYRRVASRLLAPFRRWRAPATPVFATEEEAVRYLLEPRPFHAENPDLAPLEPIEVAAR
ncbi:MAG TPA: glycosyltransferase [Thermoanaerobaculia bacterium]|nr:glycosyltransferase [Thermoanaerobaculia bacterium]